MVRVVVVHNGGAFLALEVDTVLILIWNLEDLYSQLALLLARVGCFRFIDRLHNGKVDLPRRS